MIVRWLKVTVVSAIIFAAILFVGGWLLLKI